MNGAMRLRPEVRDIRKWEGGAAMAEMLKLPAGMSRSSREYARICTEFSEMPGMRLTVPQAARLFNLEVAECVCILQALVSDGTLRTDGQEYVSACCVRRHRAAGGAGAGADAS
jgi:hypothetical protein